jgi:hypothetical protein
VKGCKEGGADLNGSLEIIVRAASCRGQPLPGYLELCPAGDGPPRSRGSTAKAVRGLPLCPFAAPSAPRSAPASPRCKGTAPTAPCSGWRAGSGQGLAGAWPVGDPSVLRLDCRLRFAGGKG